MQKASQDINGTKIVRELDLLIVQLCANGLTSQKISEYLKTEKEIKYSPRTIESKLDKLKTMFGCNSTINLVATFFRNKLIE